MIIDFTLLVFAYVAYYGHPWLPTEKLDLLYAGHAHRLHPPYDIFEQK